MSDRIGPQAGPWDAAGARARFLRWPAFGVSRRGRRQPAALRVADLDLEQLGPRGILIEPQPDSSAALRQERTAGVFAVACSSPDEAACGRCTSPARCLRSTATGWRPVPSRSGSSTSRCACSTISWPRRRRRSASISWSVDVEGHELEVLSGFDFARWRPALILLKITWEASHGTVF